MDDSLLEKEGSKVIVAAVAYVLNSIANVNMSKEDIKNTLLQYKNDNSLDVEGNNVYDVFADKFITALDELVEKGE